MTCLAGRNPRPPEGGGPIGTDATSSGRHRAPSSPAEHSRGRRPGWITGLVLAVVTGGAVLAGPAVAQTPDGPDPEHNPVADAAHREPAVPGTPCGVSARACVDLESQRAWLIHDGKVTRGPMRISSGGDGEETPVGHSLRVYRKDKDHVSKESFTDDGRPAPMPFSTFFADGGIAFHSGSPDRSSGGCIHMEPADAKATFNDLQINDKVQVVNASKEAAARKALAGRKQ